MKKCRKFYLFTLIMFISCLIKVDGNEEKTPVENYTEGMHVFLICLDGWAGYTFNSPDFDMQFVQSIQKLMA